MDIFSFIFIIFRMSFPFFLHIPFGILFLWSVLFLFLSCYDFIRMHKSHSIGIFDWPMYERMSNSSDRVRELIYAGQTKFKLLRTLIKFLTPFKTSAIQTVFRCLTLHNILRTLCIIIYNIFPVCILILLLSGGAI